MKGLQCLDKDIGNNNCGLEEENDQDMDFVDIYVDNGEQVVDGNIIESKLIGSPLFCVHLEKLYNQGMVECLAEESVKVRRDLHPSIISFFCQEKENE